THVARALAGQGADLRLLVRSTSNASNIADLKADQVNGDLRNAASFETALAGCDALFHVAADYRLWVRDPEDMYRYNVDGPRDLLHAAGETTVRCVVYTSSVARMGFTSNAEPADENSPVSLANMIGPYKRSKFLAEQVAIAAARAGQDIVIVNPTTPIGER